MQILSIMYIALFMALIIVLYVVIQLVIRPWLFVQHYSKFPFIIQFKPVVSTFALEDRSVQLRNQYYARIIDMCKAKQRPLGLVRNVGMTCMVMLFDADMIRELFINKEIFVKHPFQNAIMMKLSPYGLVLLEGSWWRKHRKMISKGFDYGRIDISIEGMIESTKRIVHSLGRNPVTMNLMNFFKQSAGSIIGEIYFGYDPNQKIVEELPLTIYLSETIAYLSKLSYSPLYCATNLRFIQWGLFESHRQANKRIKLVRQAVRQIVRQCMSKLTSGTQPQRFSMWRVFSQGEELFNEEEMIDEFITFFSDGVYTTGLFMTMFTYYMLHNPACKSALDSELKQNIVQSKEPVSQKLLQNLPILNSCIKETLRLAPPVVTGIERIATQDVTFENGVVIKKDTMIMACHLVNHIDQQYHDDPLEFNPSRWIGQTKTVKSVREHPGSYIPFSIGQRNCPGQKFAQAEASILFAYLFNSFDIRLQDPNYRLQFTQRFLREPFNPIFVVLQRKLDMY